MEKIIKYLSRKGFSYRQIQLVFRYTIFILFIAAFTFGIHYNINPKTYPIKKELTILNNNTLFLAISYRNMYYYPLLLLLNIVSLFSILYNKNYFKVIEKHKKKLIDCKIVTCLISFENINFNASISRLQKGKNYFVCDDAPNNTRSTILTLSDEERTPAFHDRIYIMDVDVFKFASVKENRKMKLKKLKFQ